MESTLSRLHQRLEYIDADVQNAILSNLQMVIVEKYLTARLSNGLAYLAWKARWMFRREAVTSRNRVSEDLDMNVYEESHPGPHLALPQELAHAGLR